MPSNAPVLNMHKTPWTYSVTTVWPAFTFSGYYKQLREDLKLMGGCAMISHRSYTSLYEGLECHAFLQPQDPGIGPSQILRGDDVVFSL